MTSTLTNAIIRIIDTQGETIGTGFIVADKLAITCAHVVEFAGSRSGKTVHFVFYATGEEATATIEPDGWRAPEDEDIALLRLNDPLPVGVEPLPLWPAKGSDGHPFSSFGFPKIGGKDESHITGYIDGLINNGRWLQISSAQISPGVSGGPVFNTQTGRVVGVISEFPTWQDKFSGRNQAGDRFGRHVATNFATPTEILLEIWPDLAANLQPVRPRADFYRHILTPIHYVPRPELLADIKRILLAEISRLALTSVIKMDALHGMGGIGKSVAARILCDDPEIWAVFPDGILWATLGREITEAGLKAKLSDWITALGGVINEIAPSLESLKNKLSGLLQDKACLLIIDDVWRRKEAEWFQPGSPACRLLLTTRDAEVARNMGAVIHPIPPMREAEAIQLLEKWTEQPLSHRHPDMTRQITQRLGYLPVALRLAGAQLRRKSPATWLEQFDAHKLALPRAEEVHDSLKATFDLSLNDLPLETQRLYTTLAIFKEDEPTPFVAVARLWAELGGLNQGETADLLQDLAARALLQLAPELPPAVPAASYPVQSQDTAFIPLPSSFTLHGLLRDFIVAKLMDAPGVHAAIHRALLRAYRPTEATSWHNIPDDGYLYNHLAYHLNTLADLDDYQAGTELCGLFANDRWLHARVSEDGYRYDGYLGDLELAWRRTHAQTLAQIADNQPPTILANCLHYDLIRISINSLVANYPPTLLVQAVKTGIWSAERGLSIAREMRETSTRVETLTGLAPHLSADLLTEALTAAQQIELEYYRIEALVGLAPYLLIDKLTKILVTINRLENDYGRAQLLTKLAPHLPTDLLTEALVVARQIKDNYARVQALTGLAFYLSPEERLSMLCEALASARQIKDNYARIKALTDLIPYLLPEERLSVLAEALTSTRQIKDELALTQVLTGLAPHLSPDLLTEALAIVNQIESEWEHGEALSGLIPYLPSDLLAKTLDAAGQEGYYHVKALTALVPHLPPRKQKVVLSEAIDAARQFKDVRGYERVYNEALIALAPHLSPDLLTEALTFAQLIIDDDDCVQILSALFPYLPPDLLPEALKAAQQITVEHYRVRALTALFPHLPSNLLSDALTIVRRIKYKNDRVIALACLIPHLPVADVEAVLVEALTVARQIKDANIYFETLMGLFPYLSMTEREVVLPEVLIVIREIESEWDRNQALISLASYLSSKEQKTVLAEALATTISQIDLEWDHDEMLTSFLPHPPLDFEAKDRVAAGRINDEYVSFKTFISLFPYLSPDLLAEALAATRKIKNEQYRSEVMITLAPYLSSLEQKAVLTDVLNAIRHIRWNHHDTKVLTELASHLSPDLLAKVLTAAQQIESEYNRTQALTSLAPYLPPDLLAEALTAARQIESEEGRARVLGNLAPLLPSMERETVLTDALAAAQHIRWENHRAEVLTELAPHLPPGLLTQALIVARQIENVYAHAHANALTGLAPYLPPDLLAEALTAVRQIESEYNRVRALTGLAPYLPPDLLAQALTAARQIKNQEHHAQALASLVPHLPLTEQEEVLAEALDAVRHTEWSTRRAEVLVSLAPHLPPDLLAEALVTAQQIGNEYDRTPVLTALAPHLSPELIIEALIGQLVHPCREILEQLKPGGLYDLDRLNLPPETALALVRSVVEIGGQWEWL